MTVKYILEIKNRRSSAVIYVKEERGSGMYEFYIMQDTVRGCPHYCSFIVDAKRYVSGMKTKNKVDVLSRTG